MQSLILEQAWTLLEEEGLSGLTPQRLALKTSECELEIRKLYPTDLAILLALWYDVENQAILSTGSSLVVQDFLFEQLMAIFDILQPRRLAIRRLLSELWLSPCWAAGLLPYATRWSRHVLRQAGLKTEGILGIAKIHIFNLFCLHMMYEWAHDSTPDLSLTMARLDQGLSELLRWESKKWV